MIRILDKDEDGKVDHLIMDNLTLEQKCLKGRLSGRMEHPKGMFCYWNNKGCRFVDTENTIMVNYVDGKGKQDHYRCRCVMKEGEPVKE